MEPKHFKMFQAEVNQHNKEVLCKISEKVLTVSQDVETHTQQELKNVLKWHPSSWKQPKGNTKNNCAEFHDKRLNSSQLIEEHAPKQAQY